MNRLSQVQFWKDSAAKGYLRLVGLFVGLALFAREAYVSLLALNVSQISWNFLLLPIGICTFFYLIQMLSWALIMECLRTPVGINETIKWYTLSFLPRYIPGGVWGYWSRGQWLKHVLGTSYTISTLGSIIEACAFVITAIAMGLCIFSERWGKAVLVIIFSGLALCWLILGAIIDIILGRRLPAMFTQHPRRFSHLEFLLKWMALLGTYITFWTLYGITVALIAQTTTSLAEVQIAIACAALAWVAGFIVVIIPGGLGVREITLASLLNLTIGLPLLDGRLIAVVFRAIVILAEMLWLLIGLLFHSLSKYKV
ncbi:MAG: lysylphosphatidylglycerol synthase domain-containing protein [Candidatus Hadarchaeum sp.]|uniref:lysylphosphatidylglycerol synthase domain-containing protein n=1 Tax=Candidatus Hadarchaeum sp. TaxID=2883567 RepID=UPI003170841B